MRREENAALCLKLGCGLGGSHQQDLCATYHMKYTGEADWVLPLRSPGLCWNADVPLEFGAFRSTVTINGAGQSQINVELVVTDYLKSNRSN